MHLKMNFQESRRTICYRIDMPCDILLKIKLYGEYICAGPMKMDLTSPRIRLITDKRHASCGFQGGNLWHIFSENIVPTVNIQIEHQSN